MLSFNSITGLCLAISKFTLDVTNEPLSVKLESSISIPSNFNILFVTTLVNFILAASIVSANMFAYLKVDEPTLYVESTFGKILPVAFNCAAANDKLLKFENVNVFALSAPIIKFSLES